MFLAYVCVLFKYLPPCILFYLIKKPIKLNNKHFAKLIKIFYSNVKYYVYFHEIISNGIK